MLLERLAEARQQTDRLFKLVRPDSLYERPIPERHRIVFYLGHLQAFDWNLLQSRLPNTKHFDAGLDQLFAFGIDPVDGGLPSDRPQDWPVESQVNNYRDRIRGALDTALAHTDFAHWGGEEPPSVILSVAIEHRMMHAETLAYMLHQLPVDQKISDGQVELPQFGAPAHGMVQIPEGSVTLGLRRDDPSAFGWDNEYEAHTVHVPAFMLDRYKVTNAQFLEFMLAGGYQEQSFWSADDWNWITQHGIAHPVFWKKNGEAWSYRRMFDEIPLPADWPVYVSHAEASAYARWAGKRLPTEAEWQRASCGTPQNPGQEHGYFDFGRWDPFAVNAVPQSRSAFGVEGMLANGWEWTSSLFEPYPGFQPFPFYEGYSANFFDGKHYVMKGGSPRTDASMLRHSFRNWFQPHYQYVYAGFRCAR